LQPEEISNIDGVDAILGANEKFRLFEFIDSFEKNDVSCIFRSPEAEISGINAAFSADNDSRTRAFLKIQDGCDYKCSFCTIPLARGKSRSLPVNEVIQNAQKIIDAGYKEIILTGVNTGDYNYQNGSEYKLIDILYKLEKLSLDRIRISSIEPNLLNDEIINLVSSSEKFCKHFHIPLQSGDSEILKLMRRRYNASYYENLILKIKDKIPTAGIGVDVISGFPGESEVNFQNTYNFLNSLPVSYLHTFTYSERKNTNAISLPEKVDVGERRKRSEILRRLSDKKRFDFYSEFINTNQTVLFESKKPDNSISGYTSNYIRISGYTSNYIRVIYTGNEISENEIKEVKLTETNGINPVKAIPVK